MGEEVSYICKRTVISTKPVEPRTFSPLSVLDRIMERNHLRIVLYYDLPTRRLPGELTKELRVSISETLSSFPPVLGRLLTTPEGHWTVKCNDAGVRMVEAKVHCTLQEWLHKVDREKELKLVHWEEMFHKPYFWSTFYVQISEFECGGLAIGLSCTHMLSDPTSATLFLKAWADMAVGAGIAAPPLFRPLPSPPPNTTTPTSNMIISHYKSAMLNTLIPTSPTAKSQDTVTLHFNQAAVESCIAMAGDPRLSPFEALAAILWTRISQIKGGTLDISIGLDARILLGLDKTFFGNCTVYKKVAPPLGRSSDSLLAEAAAAIREAISGMDGDEVMGLIEWLEREETTAAATGGGCLVCLNLEGVEAYSAVFEEGAAPVRAAYYIQPAEGGAGQVIVMPPPGGGEGRVASVTMEEDEARKLLEDAVIQRLTPTVIMGLKN